MNKEFSEPPSRSGTPGTTVESPAPSHASARSASPARIMSSPASSEPSSVDNKYLDVELELAKSVQSSAEKNLLPKLRLNIALASDPAANPDAKEIKGVGMADGAEDDDDDEDKDECRQESIAATINIIPENIVVAPPRIPVYTCVPCGIKFSSASTLDAHQKFYCSHRKDQDEPTPALPKAASAADNTSGEPPTKSIKTGKQYACSQCSYSADKKVSLNRHMRMHQTSPAASSASNGTEDVVLPPNLTPQPTAILNLPPDRYCADCDIRFSSTKTYRAHKQHYCQSRHRDGYVSLPFSFIVDS